LRVDDAVIYEAERPDIKACRLDRDDRTISHSQCGFHLTAIGPARIYHDIVVPTRHVLHCLHQACPKLLDTMNDRQPAISAIAFFRPITGASLPVGVDDE